MVVRDGRQETIACDGVVFTGGFGPENALLKSSQIAVDPRTLGPIVDQFDRCSDPAYFACGNMLHPVESAGRCYREGLRTGTVVAEDLAGRIPAAEHLVPVHPDAALRYVTPQVVALPTSDDVSSWAFNARARSPLNGRLSLRVDGTKIWSGVLRALPERYIKIPSPGSIDAAASEIRLDFVPKR